MTLARTDLIGAELSISGATGTSASFTPPANSLLVVSIFHFNNGSDDSAGLSISGGGLTYTSRKIQDILQGGFGGSTTSVQQVWTAPVGGSPSSMTIAITGNGFLNIIDAHIVAYTGYDVGSPIGADGSFLNPYNTTGINDSASITLSANPASTSVVFGSICCGANGSAGPVTVGAGWTEIYDFVSNNVNELGHQSQQRTGSTSSTVSWADVDTNNFSSGLWGCGGYALEIKEAGGAAAAPFVPEDTSVTTKQSYPVSLRTWVSGNLSLLSQVVVTLPPGEVSFELTRRQPAASPTWTWQYNPNLIGKDVFPPGRLGVLYDDPSRGYLPPGRTWTWQYNLNLIAKDALPPGKRSFERPQPLDWRRDWTQNLLLSTLSIVVQRPFNQYDWPLPVRASQPDRTWVSSAATLQLMLPPPGDIFVDLPPAPQSWRRDWTQNLVLLTLAGQDAFPPGQSRYDRPQPVAWSQGWTQNLLLSTLAPTTAAPFSQFDWPLPIRSLQPDRTFVTSFNPNLVGQDVLPPGQQRTEAPPPVSWRRDWTQSLVLSTLVGQDQLPPGAISNRILAAAPQQRDWAQNLLLSTLTPVIQTPFNQYDWTIPQRPQLAGQTWTLNLLLSTLAPAIVLPLNQYDWPVPQRFSQPGRGFAASFNLNLIAQDQLPFRQSDWPLPQGYYYPLSVKGVAALNLNLFPPPEPVPAGPITFRNPQFIGNTTGQMGSWS